MVTQDALGFRLRELDWILADERFSFHLRRKAELLLSMLEGKRVVDVGCGTGALMQFISSAGYETVGLDVSDLVLAEAKRKGFPGMFVKADICDIRSMSKFVGYFDSVIMSEILEHIPNDDLALHNAFCLLKPSGILLVTVPAFQVLYGYHDRNMGHHRRYMSKGIVSKIESAGFYVEYSRYWNVPGLFGWMLASRLLRTTPNQLSFPALRRLYDSWLRFENSVTFPFGLTIVTKARRSPTDGPKSAGWSTS